ncbi:MAG: tRNA pseudouridine(38-40) synthase TruA [Clostridiaceae bacterium]|nr:tRNA pseudouridine(38-40) synthase TruA [Clostridiaceae bacterium]
MTFDPGGRRNIALLTEYDGSVYHGWQFQDNAASVQQTIQDSWLELTGEKMSLTSSSRTDAGVSARAHVSNFLTSLSIPAERVPLALNSVLPEAISIRAAAEVDPKFNSRVSPTGKRYCYRYWLGSVRPALMRHLTAHVPGPLDIERMRAALPALTGKHDFTCMMDQGSVRRNTVRTIHDLSLKQEGKLLTLTVDGDGFLYHMIRILAGTLLYIGQGKLNDSDLPAAFAAGDRKLTGMTMPAQGLCLEWVYYDPPIFDEALLAPTEGGII